MEIKTQRCIGRDSNNWKIIGNLNFEKNPTYLVMVIAGRGNKEAFVRNSVS